MARWITSDTHFFHKNILHLCNRPFQTIDEMNNEIINRWNSIVKPDDIVLHLGDVCFSNKDNIEKMVSSLNGYKILILGNHDEDRAKNPYWWVERGFDEAYRGEYRIGDYLLTHRAKQNLEYGLFNLHGHNHNRPITDDWYTSDLYMNVGQDVHDFYPINLDEIIGEE